MAEIAHAIEDATTADTPAPARPASDGAETKVGYGAEEQKEQQEVDELPNGGYGWVIVFSLLGLNACTWGKFKCRTGEELEGGGDVDLPSAF
jgi:hypothetical protein